MANYSRWDDVKKRRPAPTAEVRVEVEHDLALGQLIYGLRTEAGLSQRALAERMGTTQSVISRLEEGGGAKNRLDTLPRVATALDLGIRVCSAGIAAAQKPLEDLSKNVANQSATSPSRGSSSRSGIGAPSRWSRS